MIRKTPQVETLGDHAYVVRVSEGDETVEIRLRATPGVVGRIGGLETDELRIVEATAAYLIARQRADDLPASLDLDDVAAAYPDYVDTISAQLGR